MNLEELTSHLYERVTQAEDWSNDGFPGEISGFAIRAFPCTAKALHLLHDPSRKESHGLVFRVSWEGRSGKSYADLDVRLNPEGSMSREGHGRAHNPYYAVYLPAIPGTDGLVTWRQFNPDAVDTSITVQHFFRNLLAVACGEENCAKIFGVKTTHS